MAFTRIGQKIGTNTENYNFFWILGINLSFLIKRTSLNFPEYILVLAMSANLLKLTSMISSYTFRLKNINKDYSNNFFDIPFKCGLQESISVLFGSILGFSASLFFTQTFQFSIFLVFSLAITNVFTSLQSLKYLKINDFNFQKAARFCNEFVISKQKKLLSPIEIALKETLIFSEFANIKFCNFSPDILLNSDKNGYIIRIIDMFK